MLDHVDGETLDYDHPFSSADNAVAEYFEYRLRKDDFYNDPLGKFIRNVFDNNLASKRTIIGGMPNFMAGGLFWKYVCPFTAGPTVQNWSAISFDRVYGSVERQAPFVVDFSAQSRYSQFTGIDMTTSYSAGDPPSGWSSTGASDFWRRVAGTSPWSSGGMDFRDVADQDRTRPTDYTILASADDIVTENVTVTQKITRSSGIPEELITMLGTLLYTKITSIISPEMHIHMTSPFDNAAYSSGSGQRNKIVWGYHDEGVVNLYEGLVHYGKEIVGDSHFGTYSHLTYMDDATGHGWWADGSTDQITAMYSDQTTTNSGASTGNQTAYVRSGVSSLFSYVINKTLEIQSYNEYILNFFFAAGAKFDEMGRTSFDSWVAISSKFGEWNVDPHPLDGLTYENIASSLYAFHQLFKFSRSYLGDVPMNPYAGDAFNFTWFPSDTIPTCEEIDVLLAIMVDGGVIGSEYDAEGQPLYHALDSESGDPTGYSGNRANWRDDSTEIVPQNLSKRIISVGLPLGFMDYMRSVAGSCDLSGLDYRNAHIIRVRVHKIDLRYDSVVFIPQTYLFDTRLFYSRENGAQGIREFYDELTWEETDIDAYATGDISTSRIISDNDTTLDTSSWGVKGQQVAWQSSGGPNGKYMLTAIKLPDIVDYETVPEVIAMDLTYNDFAGTGTGGAFIKEDLGYSSYTSLEGGAATSIFQNHMASHMLKVYQKVMCSINHDEHSHFFNNESGVIMPNLGGPTPTLDHHYRLESTPFLYMPDGTAIINRPATTSLLTGYMFSKLYDSNTAAGADSSLEMMIDGMTRLLDESGLSIIDFTSGGTDMSATTTELALGAESSGIPFIPEAEASSLGGMWHTINQIALAPLQSQVFSAYTYQHRAVEPKAFERIFSILVDVNSFKRIDPSGGEGAVIDPRDPFYEPGTLGASDTSINEPGFYVFFTSIELLNHGGATGGYSADSF